MGENRTRPTDASVEDYITSRANEEQRADCEAVLVEAGLSPMEALQAATTRPAEFLGDTADFGTVKVGKDARVDGPGTLTTPNQ